jgi:hypothetical protein
MEKSSPWKAQRFLDSQEIPHILWKPKVHYHVYNSLFWAKSIQSTPPYHCLKIHFKIVLPFKPWSTKWSFNLRIPHQNPVHTCSLPHTLWMPHPSHSFGFDHPSNSRRGIEITKLLIMLTLHCPVALSFLGPNILLGTLFPKTLCLRPYSTWKTKFHTNTKDRQNYSSVYFNFLFLNRKLEDNRFCTDWQQAFTDLIQLLVSSWMKFWYVKAVPKYMKCYTLSQDSLSLFIL